MEVSKFFGVTLLSHPVCCFPAFGPEQKNLFNQRNALEAWIGNRFHGGRL